MAKYEPQLDKFVKIVKRLIDKDSLTYVEIGARDCKETIAFDQMVPNSRIFAFECNPDTLPQCRYNISNKKNITLIEKAVSDKEGTLDFFKIDNEKTVTNHPDGINPGASSLFQANPDYELEKYVQQKITVETTTLKKFSCEYSVDQIDAVWMDVQGAELMVLRGAEDFLSKIMIIHTEVEFFPIYQNQPLFKDIKKYLNDHGFGLYSFTTMGKYAADAVFVNKKLIKPSQFSEFFTYTWFRGKEKVQGKIRKLMYGRKS